ncbi:TonB-dependent receptor [Sphingomonas sp. CJ99]
MRSTARLTLLLLVSTAPAAVSAQVAPPTPPTDAGGAPVDPGDAGDDAIVVTGQRPPGQVASDVAPELRLSPADIRAYGVSSITELLEELTPQTRSGRGRGGGGPVVLLNGRRIGGFGEIRDIPTEAILRVDVLPEEAALAYGYRADQRVVNFVLRPRFRSWTGELEGRVPTESGTSNLEAELGTLRLNDRGRVNVEFEIERDSRLTEAERGIVLADGDVPFDRIGNVGPGAGLTEVDPALSGLAGTPVAVAAIPTGLGGIPSLEAFLPGANAPNRTDQTPFRTLRPETTRYSGNAVLNRTLFGDVSTTASLRVEASDSLSLLGLPTATLTLPAANRYSPFADEVRLYRILPGDPLMRQANSLTTSATISMNGDIPGGWRWSANLNADRTLTRTMTDRSADAEALQAQILADDGSFSPFGPLDALGPFGRSTEQARSESRSASVDGLVAGSPFTLPAGRSNLSVRVRAAANGFAGRSERDGVVRLTERGRDIANIRTSLSLPIADQSNGVLPFLGDLSVNGDVEVERLSDAGTLTTLGYGLNWTPVRPVRLLLSATHEEGAPSQAQFGDPVITTPNVTVFDFIRGETALVTRIDGGNAALVRDNRDVVKAGLTLKPWSDEDLTISADYVSSVTRNPIAGFPAATAAIQAAFPDRFVRDDEGRLISIDNRPINFEREERAELRWGVNFSKRITSDAQRRIEAARAARQAEREAAEASGQPLPERPRGPGAGRPGGGPGGGFGRFGGGGGRPDFSGRFQFSAYHTLYLEQSILIRDGLAPIDLLNGGATGNNGGQPRHVVEVRTGYSRDGIGVRLNADYRSGTSVDGGPTGGNQLDFSELATVDLRFFADLGAQRSWVRANPWLRGSRVTLGINNLFNTRQQVTDANGIVPLNYQPGYVDALGRSVRVSFRKLLF